MRCYQCNSQTDPACATSPPRTALVDCETQESVNYNRLFLNSILPRDMADSTAGAPRFCHKIVLQSGTVARTCLEANAHNLGLSCQIIENAAKLFHDPNRQIKHCSVCDKDECNAAGSIASSLPLAGLALLVSYLYAKQ
ncbi:hypothetical protein MSG28_013152 [Choristoneura fumiferana]|uniref:Uncharacterized protein n=2 Tax=Choristoneura fumiferana TaxID=7141 RepID=A0ACC0KST2_CHOFU|nr:hypothetical protein MSG28_013152 [Choristoneura fumiferana]